MSDEIRQLKITPDTVEGFKLLQKLGQGSTGTVFKARRLSDGVTVAVKILFPALSRSPGFNERFLRLAQLGSRFDHPNVVRTLASGLSNGFHFVVMEFVEAKTLENVLARGAMDESRALQIALSIARALEHAQQAGVVHRDVKPANILLPRGGEARLADLGLAVVAAQGTAAGGVTGTPHYLSPEAARGEAALDIRADVYSLGATLHHMLTGQTLFPGSDVARIIAAQLSEKPKPPSKVNSTVSVQASKLVERLTEKKAGDRPTPTEAALIIDAILRGEKPFETVSRRGQGAKENAAAQTEIADACVVPPSREDETEVSEQKRKNSPTAIVAPPVIPARQTSPREETVAGWPGPQIPARPGSPAAHGSPSPYPPVPPAGSPPGQRPQ
ncbi:MAG: serine/threonine protein kinase, partial [Candidatus Brocadiae bacterium]|nr:serine/threonine protein kinase [Candidatus Brocadiia bacterium]